MNSPRRSSSLTVLLGTLFIAITLALSACAPAPATTQVAPTNTVPPPATATQTPAPTDTPTPAPTDTPTSTPTPDLTATSAAQATATVEAALAKIKPELEKVNLHAEDGQLVWVSSEETDLSVSTYDAVDYKAIDDAGSLKDFVIHADIGWDSTSGLAGCGLIFRADDDFKNGGQYQLLLIRLQSAPIWAVDFMKFGKVQFPLNENNGFSNAIIDEPNSVNKITLVARGQNIFTYINGEKMVQLESSKQMEGKVGFLIEQESGKTECTFNNSWVYSLK
jgi:hypothetical protein